MSGMSTRRRERGASPDSTTQLKQLEVGDEVLSHGKDGLYYFGYIDYVDENTDKVRVKFEDKDKKLEWSLIKDIKKLKSASEPSCSVCDSSCAYPSNNRVLVCSSCSTPYHQHCHQPVIPNPPPTKAWICKKCECDSKKRAMKIELPYDIGSLTWDGRHRVNSEQLYCYCGGPGEWNVMMLQCQRCKQWFHENCVDCLEFPLLFGDGLYVFVCRVCNEGEEFVHRLELRWEDIVHLVIYNLTVLNSYMFHDLHDSILLYMNDNWDKLQPPNSISNCSMSKRIRKVEHVLQTKKSRFMCGREKHKKSTMWALRKQEVAPTPTIILPPGKLKNVPKFKIVWDKRWKSTNGRLSSPELADSESELQKSEQDSVEESSDDETYVPKRKAKDRKKAKDIEKLLTMPTPPSARLKLRPRPDTSDQSEASSHKVVTNGEPEHKHRGRRRLFDNNKAGDSDSYSETVRITSDKTVLRFRRKRRREESEESRKSTKLIMNAEKNGGSRRAIKKRESTSSRRCVSAGETSDEETSSRGTLDSFIPAPLDFEGPNNPFRALIDPAKTVALKSVKKEEDSQPYRRRKEAQPATKYASLSPAPKGSRVEESPEVSPLKESLMSTPSSSLEFIHDLKCSVNSLFSASNRISSGERYNVLAKRVCTDTGRVQYLIEWESP